MNTVQNKKGSGSSLPAQRRERERHEMRRMILDAAMDLFVTEGYEQVSIRRIGEKIEYSPATIYLYFKDKDEILYELHNDSFDRFYEAEVAVNALQDPLERLRALAKVYVNFGLSNPQHYELMFILKAPAIHQAEARDWSRSFRTFDFLRGIVEDCLKAGRIRPGDPHAISLGLWSLVHGFVSLLLRERMAMVPGEVRDRLVSQGLEYMMETIKA